ncbi:YwmB family TATA-box binding protein [Paramaledivibacter caminithermalis]|jgi:hypothetical protein|uniref:TATA-box binding n=1 Tax=Paramaledivibacter caminithermalis (strain DSM 15212 / CIP 107654 / DViRD3) TaxID=1121301 RepID=A0A1M6L3N1_PARC5|nr:YwmB family TATA-box binding protein [Paramaledivibacter caminithermalis]SHJ65800.1 TATA-box binding [Paramaledivibacter caminithermalis DSM 15212]
MYKKLFIYICILLFSVSIVFGNTNENLKPEVAVETIFTESGAVFDHVNINSYVIIKDEFKTIDNVTKICNDISEKLNIKEINLKKENDENYCFINARGIIEEGEYVTVIVQSSRSVDLRESSIVVDVIETKEQYDLEELCSKIRYILSSYGKVNLNINLSGYYNGLVSNKELQENINKLLNIIGAKKVEGISEDKVISITGYTPNIKKHISYCGRKANINIASRYNSYENRTDILIGTPLIVLEY